MVDQSKLNFLSVDGRNGWGTEGCRGQSQREKKRGEIKTKRTHGRRFAGGWTGGELSSGNPCRPGMRSVE